MSDITHQTPSTPIMTRIPTHLSSNHHLVPQMPQNDSHLSSGFDTLPVELQGLIFEQYLPDFTPITPSRKVDSPITLSLVCREWHHIALATPSLWSGMHIVVQDGGSNTTQARRICNQLERWLALSKSHPLFVRLEYNYNRRGSRVSECSRIYPEALGSRIVSMLRAHVGRWQNVVFQCPSTLLRSLVDVDGSAYAQLRGFTLDVTNTPSTACAVDFRNLHLPLSALTQLHLVADYNRLLSLSDCRDLLARCPRLRRCSLNAEFGERDSAGEGLQASGDGLQANGEHPHSTCALEQLSIQLRPRTGTDVTHVPQALASFLDALSLTSLTSLTLEWMGNVAPSCAGGASHLAKTLARCAKLENLGLRYIPLGTKDLLACLRGLSGLTKLALAYTMSGHNPQSASPVDREFLSALECGTQSRSTPQSAALSQSAVSPQLAASPQAPLLPHLLTLRLVAHCADISEEDVLAFLGPRVAGQPGVDKLRSFKFLWGKRVSPDLTRSLVDLRRPFPGVELDVDSFGYDREY
ncbi:uncharacterized protein SCHCODRAFT_02500974 [Schizophyllum commune H4-8]|uniref:Expressed protein n=1 Tax=Schizophyllum commune (strain H4-8 / FGSC 9210) TaxID=578458 RepID=D8PLI1_SCHCM|nr:uncharacterized protein SCHCODRAFT_02500974 [Schizophyllum commune H4-8]KAI5894363.1 hypothetical protein SCHCODRAFT_02500974 [Schizophyllum commune H4-8]